MEGTTYYCIRCHKMFYYEGTSMTAKLSHPSECPNCYGGYKHNNPQVRDPWNQEQTDSPPKWYLEKIKLIKIT